MIVRYTTGASWDSSSDCTFVYLDFSDEIAGVCVRFGAPKERNAREEALSAPTVVVFVLLLLPLQPPPSSPGFPSSIYMLFFPAPHSHISAISEVITGRVEDTCPDDPSDVNGAAKSDMGIARMDILRSEIACEFREIQ